MLQRRLAVLAPHLNSREDLMPAVPGVPQRPRDPRYLNQKGIQNPEVDFHTK